MKTKHIFWGIFFITLGVFILIDKIYNLNFTWDGVWKLWPVVLILWGIGLIINKSVVKMIITGLTAFFLAFALFATFSYGHWVIGKGFYFTTDNYNDNDSSFAQNNYKVGYETKYKKADFTFKAGAGSFIIKDSTEELFNAETQGPQNNYTLNTSDEGDKSKIIFEMKSTKLHLGNNKLRNRVEMSFNPMLQYDMNFDIGAASVDFDLSPYKLGLINVNTGAASLNLKLGNKSNECHLNLDAGAASIEINVPEEAGCEIESDASLSSKDYNGFKKVNENLYRTENFSSSGKKIYLHLKSGISSIKVSRYSGNNWE